MARVAVPCRLLACVLGLALLLIAWKGPCAAFSPREDREEREDREIRGRRDRRNRPTSSRLRNGPRRERAAPSVTAPEALAGLAMRVPPAHCGEAGSEKAPKTPDRDTVEITSVVVEAEAPVCSYTDRWVQQALDDAGYQHTISYWLSASLEDRGDHPDRCFPLPEWIRDMNHAHELEITPRCGIDWSETMPFELRFGQEDEDEERDGEDRWWERFLPDRRFELGSRGNRVGSNIVMPNPPRPLKWGKQLLRFEIEY